MFFFQPFNCGGSARHLPVPLPPEFANGPLVLDIVQLSEYAGENVGSKRHSETVYRKGLPWNIMAKFNTKKDSTEKWLDFYLQCAAPKEVSSVWQRFKLSLKMNGTKDWTGKFSDVVFTNKLDAWGFYTFISFAELMIPSKGLYDEYGDKVTLAIDFTADETENCQNLKDKSVLES
ncbi:hypothetical protein niasHT_008971 [Heterodera trifolii]|uniref:MATH domain-containing protein n=1 Tax=Heterodera trifolii TaxID=157864 RepID=A0ABD2LYK7_9BILA